MTNRIAFASALAIAALLTGAPAEAKGCLKGAVVGGVAGHMAGHGKMGRCRWLRHRSPQRQQEGQAGLACLHAMPS